MQELIESHSTRPIGHHLGMEPKDLLKALMDRAGDNPHSLAAKVRQRTKQPQIYRFLMGTAKEPRRTTLQPIADHYQVSVEAFYNHDLADEVMAALEGKPMPSKPQTAARDHLAAQLSHGAIELGLLFDELRDPQDRAKANMAASREILAVIAERDARPTSARKAADLAQKAPEKHQDK